MFWPIRRKTVRQANSFRFRPEIEALESRWVPSTITEFPLPPLSFGGSLGATAITAGPDGNVWFSDPVAGAVGRITPSGQVTEFTPPFHSAGVITTGPDGNLWLTSSATSFTGNIGRITPAGQITAFTLPDQFVSFSAITAGPDGNVWFTENGGFPGKIGMDGSEVAAAVAAGRIADVRGYCECDVMNTYLVYQRFRRLRGEIDAGEYSREISLARERVAAIDAPHWREFIVAWDRA